MDKINLKCMDITKSFNGKVVFKNVNINLTESTSLVVNGRNGSGKSTILKVISHLIRLDKGKIELKIKDKLISKEKYFSKIGFLSPYINLYDELTGQENLDLFYDLKVEQKNNKAEEIKYLLEKVGLYKRRDELIRNYSSGMKQRLKIAFAVISKPALLLMDEPRTNLDDEGISVVYKVAEEQKERGILILATNERDDNEICESSLNIEEYK